MSSFRPPLGQQWKGPARCIGVVCASRCGCTIAVLTGHGPVRALPTETPSQVNLNGIQIALGRGVEHHSLRWNTALSDYMQQHKVFDACTHGRAAATRIAGLIDRDRLEASIDSLSAFESRADGGVCRQSPTSVERQAGRLADRRARARLQNVRRRLWDPVHTSQPREDISPVPARNHIDTPPAGGPLDGPYGRVGGARTAAPAGPRCLETRAPSHVPSVTERAVSYACRWARNAAPMHVIFGAFHDTLYLVEHCPTAMLFSQAATRSIITDQVHRAVAVARGARVGARSDRSG